MPVRVVLSCIGALWTAPMSFGLPLAHAADILAAAATRDVQPIGSGYVLKKGQLDEAVTQYQVYIRTGRISFCSRGGSCFTERVEAGGDLLLALKLTSCQVSSRGSPPLLPDDPVENSIDSAQEG